MGKFKFANGTSRNVHPLASCRGRHCVIHAPSAHSMVTWPMVLRETGLVERQCPHGTGHPDPDSVDYFNKYDPIDGRRGSWGVHGCDGCCLDPDQLKG